MERKFVSEAQLDVVLDDFDSAVLILDADDDINTLNDYFCKLIGVDEKQIIYQNFGELYDIPLFAYEDVKDQLN